MASLASKLLSRGDEIRIELGRIIIQSASGKPVPSEWLKQHTTDIAQEILTALGIEAYVFCSYTTGHYGRHKASGVTLQFLSPTTDASPYVIFNAELTRCRNVGSTKKGAALPKGHFRIGKRHHFYRFWKSTGLPEPKRLSSFHDYMGNLKGILFTAPVQNDRMDADSLRPLSVPSPLVRAAILPGKLRAIPGHLPDNFQTKMPDKDFAQSQGAHAFQAKQPTGDKNHGNKVIQEHGGTGVGTPPRRHKRPEDQSVDEWLADFDDLRHGKPVEVDVQALADDLGLTAHWRGPHQLEEIVELDASSPTTKARTRAMVKENGLVNRAQGVTYTNRVVEHLHPTVSPSMTYSARKSREQHHPVPSE